jgi:predicted nucleotidyltransferase
MSANLFPSSRAKLLTLFFTHPQQEFYINQIIRTVKLGNGIVQQELEKLHALGIITQRYLGNLRLFKANQNSPIYEEIKGLVIKTFGVTAEIKAALAKLNKDISLAFIFGSFASGEFTSQSDIDLLVISNLPFKTVSSALNDAEAKLSREINPVVFTAWEFKRRISSGDGFLLNVLKGDKIFVLGGEDELGAMAG